MSENYNIKSEYKDISHGTMQKTKIVQDMHTMYHISKLFDHHIGKLQFFF